jgi:hypothetical protein
MVFPGERKLKKKLERQILKDFLVRLLKKLLRFGSGNKSAKLIK